MSQHFNIMVVEDEIPVSEYLQETLKGLGYKPISSVSSGEEAIEKSHIEHPDLVLMDYKLKGKLNGVETARRIRQILDVPVIFITAYNNKEMIDEIIQSEPFGYLLKPVDEKVLYTTIETAITRHRLETVLKENEQLAINLNIDLESRVTERTKELEVSNTALGVSNTALKVSNLELENSNLELKSQIGLRVILEEELRLSLGKEKELNELKNRFISTTSHEFRTPLSIILSSAELLEIYGHKWSDDKKKEVLHRIIVSVKNMTSLLQDILFLNKDEAGKQVFQPQPLDLKKFLLATIEETRSSDRREWLINCIGSGESQPVWVDENLLRQILNNLLSNAMKYSLDRQEIEVELIWEASEVQIRVKDHGIGIPAADHINLFKSFFRATNVGSIGGTGLGLTIVKRAVEHHGGHIKVESTEGEGTTFTVTLPITLPAADHLILPTIKKYAFNQDIVVLEQQWWLLEKAVENTKMGIIIIDQQTEDKPIVYCNTGFEKMTGYNHDEILGKNYFLLLGKGSAQSGIEEVGVSLEADEDTRVVVQNYGKDGGTFLGELNLSPVRNSSGTVVNTIVIIQDVTHRRRNPPVN